MSPNIPDEAGHLPYTSTSHEENELPTGRELIVRCCY
jgi:hypothetical protein